MPHKPSWGYSKATVRVIRAQYRIIRKRFGAVTPRNIVEHARDPQCPLHRFFDWDDTSAAEKWRLEQAGNLIRRVQVFVTRDGVKQPVRVYVSSVRNDVRQYEELTDVLTDKRSAASYIEELRRDLEAVVRRFETVKFCAKSLRLVRAAIEALDEPKRKRA